MLGRRTRQRQQGQSHTLADRFARDPALLRTAGVVPRAGALPGERDGGRDMTTSAPNIAADTAAAAIITQPARSKSPARATQR